MADAQLKAVITAEDKASKVIADVGGSLDKVQSKLQSMQPAFKAMAAVGTIALGAIAAVAFQAVKDYQDVETANKMLEHAVVDVTHATREQLKATSDLADALERKGVLDSDNIKVGLAQLSTFGLSNDAVRKLGGSLADLAVNQFGVSASGDQLADSANMIAKALHGQFGILEKSGIRFTDAQKHMIEFGTEMQKVTALNEGFQQNLKFTNDVALATFAGKLAHVKVQLNGLSENIGKALLPALDNLLAKLSPVIEKVSIWVDQHPELITRILAVSAAVSGLVAILGSIGLVLPGVITTVSAFSTLLVFLATTPLGLVLTAIGLLVAGFILLYTKSEGLKDAIQKVEGKITGLTKAFNDHVVQSVIVQNILAALVASYNQVKDAIINNLWPALQQLWTTVKQELWPALLELWEALKPLAPYFELAAKIIGAVLVVALLFLIQVLEKVILIVVKVIEWWAKLTAWVIKEGKPVIEAFTKVISGVADAFMDVVNWVDKALSKINSFVQSVAKVDLNPFSKGFNIPGLSGRASGGSVSPNRSFIVGENGPELFTPQSYGTISNGGSGAGIVINLTGNTFMGREGIAEQIGNDIMRALKRNANL